MGLTMWALTGKAECNKRMIESILTNEKYMSTVIVRDSVTPDQLTQATECVTPIIAESEYRSVQEERLRRSNQEIDENGNVKRKNTKYSLKKRKLKILFFINILFNELFEILLHREIPLWALFVLQFNCHLYEKLGFVRTGKLQDINGRMTIVYYEKDMRK